MRRIRRNPWRSVVVPDRIGVDEAMASGVLFGPGEAELDSCYYVEQMNYHWLCGTKVRASYAPAPDRTARTVVERDRSARDAPRP
jgi:hypothetical protein